MNDWCRERSQRTAEPNPLFEILSRALRPRLQTSWSLAEEPTAMTPVVHATDRTSQPRSARASRLNGRCSALVRLGILALLCVAGASSATPPAQPNVVLILFDDLGIGDLSAYAASSILTPNLDQLALDGMRFDEMYALAGNCSPARVGAAARTSTEGRRRPAATGSLARQAIGQWDRSPPMGDEAPSRGS